MARTAIQVIFDSLAHFPAVGSTTLIYIDNTTQKAYLWNGAAYVEITGGGGGTLQTVTDAGNTTTNTIIVNRSSDPFQANAPGNTGNVAVEDYNGTLHATDQSVNNTGASLDATMMIYLGNDDNYNQPAVDASNGDDVGPIGMAGTSMVFRTYISNIVDPNAISHGGDGGGWGGANYPVYIFKGSAVPNDIIFGDGGITCSGLTTQGGTINAGSIVCTTLSTSSLGLSKSSAIPSGNDQTCNIYISANSTGTSSGNFSGILAQVIGNGANPSTFTGMLRAVFANAYASNNSTVAKLVGTYNVVTNQNATITGMYGNYNEITLQAAGKTVTNAYGSFSTMNSTAGNLTNAYAYYVDSMIGTNKWGFYNSNSSAKNYFASSLQIADTTASTTSATGALIVAGGVGIAGALNLQAQNSTVSEFVTTVANSQAAPTNGHSYTVIGNTQAVAHIAQKIDLGTSAQAHTGLLINAQGASTSQRAIKIDTSTTGSGIGIEIVGTSTTVTQRGISIALTGDPGGVPHQGLYINTLGGWSTTNLTEYSAKFDNPSISTMYFNTYNTTGRVGIYMVSSSSAQDYYSNSLADTPTIFTINGNALTSGKIMSLNSTKSGALAAKSTGYFELFTSRTNTATTGTVADSYDLSYIKRTSVQNGAGGTLTSAGSVLKLENSATQTAGTLTDTVDVLKLNQSATSTGFLINGQQAGVTKFSVDKDGVIAIGNTVQAAIAIASTHKVTVVIGGVTYYILASNV